MAAREEDFVRAILKDPGDDSLRLIYADWLEDQQRMGQAEFVRIQIELAGIGYKGETCPKPQKKRLPPLNPPFDTLYAEKEEACGSCPYCRLKKRERESFRPLEWGGPLVATYTNSIINKPYGHPKMIWRRGFPAEVCCTETLWLREGPSVVRVCPLDRVYLADKNSQWDDTFDNRRLIRSNITPRWFRKTEYRRERDEPDDIEGPLFDCLLGKKGGVHVFAHYEMEEAAFNDLSQACLRWARGAKIEPLPDKVSVTQVIRRV